MRDFLNNVIVCVDGFSLFEEGTSYYCFALDEEHFFVFSERPILNTHEFKLSKKFISKFKIK